MKCMSKLLAFFLGCMLVSGTSHPAFNYVIYGNLGTVKNNTKLYLINRNIMGRVAYVDSTIYNNGFTFKGKSDELAIYVIQSRDWKVMIPLIIEEGVINISGKNYQYIVKGGIQNEYFTQCQQLTASMEAEIERLGKLEDSCRSVKDSIGYKLYKDAGLLIQDRMLRARDSFYIKNSNAFVGLYNLWGFKSYFTPQHIDSVFQHLSPVLQNHSLGLVLKSYIKSGSLLNAIPIKQKDIMGRDVIISFSDKSYILLDFWASWCAPCRENNPRLKELYKKYKHKKFKIVSISSDENVNSWKKAVAKDSMNWINVSDLKGWNNEYTIKYGIRSLPTYILVDQDGKILLRTENEIEKVVDRIEKIFN